MDGASGLLRRPRSHTHGGSTLSATGDVIPDDRRTREPPRPLLRTVAEAGWHPPTVSAAANSGPSGSARDQRRHSDTNIDPSARLPASTLAADTEVYALEDPAGIILRWNIREETNANDWIGLFLSSEVDASKWIDYRNKGVNGAKKGEIAWKFDYIVCHFVEPKTQVCFKYYHGNTGELRASTAAITITKKVPRPVDEQQLTHNASANFVRFVIKDVEAIHLRKGLFFNPDPYIKMWLEPAANARAVTSRTTSGSSVTRGSQGLLAHHHRQQRTSVCEDTTAPVWPHQEFAFRALPTDVLYMKLMDKFVSSRPTLNRYLGHVILPVKAIQEKAKASIPLTLNVIGRSPTDKVSGTVRLYVDLMNDAAAESYLGQLRQQQLVNDAENAGLLSSSDDEDVTQHEHAVALQGRASTDVNGASCRAADLCASDDASDDQDGCLSDDLGAACKAFMDESYAESNGDGLSSDEELFDDQEGACSSRSPPGGAVSFATKPTVAGDMQGSKDDLQQMVERVHRALGSSCLSLRSSEHSGEEGDARSNQSAHFDKGSLQQLAVATGSPRLGSVDGLPAGWTTALDSCGRMYYVDRISKTVSWSRPEENARLRASWRNSTAAMSMRSLPTSADSADALRHRPATVAEAAAVAAAANGAGSDSECSASAGGSQHARAQSSESAEVYRGLEDNNGCVSASAAPSTASSDHPALRFLTGSELFSVVQGDDAAMAEYMQNPALKRCVQMIRHNPSAFERYVHNADLVSFVNKFALTKHELPDGWKEKVDRNGKRLFVNTSAKWTTYIDPRLPLSHVPVQPPITVPLPQGRYKVELFRQSSSTGYDSSVVAFLRQANAMELLQSRWPPLKKNVPLKELLTDIIADGASALQKNHDNVDLMMLLSIFEEDIMTYVAPPPATSRETQVLGDPHDDPYHHPHAHTRHIDDVAPHKQGFQEKYRAFRKKLEVKGCGAGPHKIKLRIRRDNILQDAFNKIMSYNKKELQKNVLLISFSGEEGLDYGGPAREFFFLFSRELFNPYYGLFEYSAYDMYTVQISPVSQFIDNASEWFRFAGRMLGLGIVHQYLMDCYFTRPFYKMLLGIPCSLNDLESLDAEFHRSLVWIRDNNVTSCGLDLTFSVDEEAFGQIVEHELKPGGKNVAVTEKNKKDYIERMVKWRISRGITEQKQSLLRGFREVLDPKLLTVFDAKELELVIAGTAEIDVSEWKRNTEYRSGYHADHPVIKRFWQCVESFDSEQRLRLLQFVTGTSSIPFEGFAALRGSHGPRKFAIELWGYQESLPRAHTCFNRLDLPPYTTLSMLRKKLLVAIEETGTFGVE